MSESELTSQTRPSLLVRIADPLDVESWRTFVDTYAPLIYRHARNKGLQDADAADVTQEVLTEVARAIRAFEYQPARGRFRDWLWTVTHRVLVRFFQKCSRRAAAVTGRIAQESLERIEAPPPEAEWTAAFHAQVLKVALERARPRFEPTTWRAFQRTWLDNLPAGEVARELAVPIETVYIAKSRVLKRLEEEVRMLAEDIPHCVPLG
jgi:RNA polymerase sigma-70 factor (ECF subfamily)